MPEVAPSSIKAPAGDDAGRPIGVSLISAVKTVLSLLSADVDSEERLFRAVTSSLAELSLRGSVMLREGDSSVLRIAAVVRHPAILQVERLAGVRAEGHRFDAARAPAYQRVLAGESVFEADAHTTLQALMPDAAAPSSCASPTTSA